MEAIIAGGGYGPRATVTVRHAAITGDVSYHNAESGVTVSPRTPRTDAQVTAEVRLTQSRAGQFWSLITADSTSASDCNLF